MGKSRQAISLVLKALGGLLLLLAFGLILVGLIGIWMEEGFSGIQRTLSPYNVVNFLVTIAVLAPGAGLFALGSKIGSRSHDELPEQQDTTLDVPSSFDLTNPAHVALLDDIRVAYGNHLADGLGAYQGCMFRPASELPYAKVDIKTALTALLDLAEGRRESPLLDAGTRQPEEAATIRMCLVLLDDFLDVPPEELPTEQRANARVGFQLQKSDR